MARGRKPKRTEPEIAWREDKGKYYINFPSGYIPRCISTRTTDKAEARRYLADVIAGMNAPPVEERKTIGAAVEAYIEHKYSAPHLTENQRSNIKAIEYTLRAPLEFFADLHITQADNVQAWEYINQRRFKGIADGSIRREICFVNAAINRAFKNRWIDAQPPMEMPPPGAPRDRLGTMEEITALLAAVDHEHVRTFILLALHTMSRPKAITELTWRRVDFSNNRIDFGTKESAHSNKRRVNIKMAPALRAHLLEAHNVKECDYVVSYKGKPVKSIRTAFNTAVERAGLEGFTRYTLKHTAISMMVMRGVDPHVISRISNIDIKTLLKYYAKYSPDYNHDVSDASNELYGKL